MSAFGDSLRKIRKEKNMTQDELAALLGTSKQVVSRYENGQRSPKVSVVLEYAEKLQVPVSVLTGESTLETIRHSFSEESTVAQKLRTVGQALSPQTASDATLSELIDIYDSLNTDGRDVLLGTARGLAANPDMKKDGTSKNGTA